MRTLLAAILVALALWGSPGMWEVAQAARVEGLYSATVSVDDSTTEVRGEALGLALSAVLVRVTGSRDAANDARLQPLLESASAYVQVYRYHSKADGLALSVTFDGEAIEQAVASAGIPVWGNERPKVIVWLAIDYGGGQRTLLSSDNEGAVANALRGAAEARGIPVSFPLMDAEDREKISFADVWGGFSQTVESASKRYQPDAILVGRARRRQGRRLGVEWKMNYASSVIASEGGITEGIESAADYFARQFVVGGQAAQVRTVRIEVTDITTLAVFARVLAHLENLSIVKDLRIGEVNGDRFGFELSLIGSSEQLTRAIKLANVLQETTSEPIDAPEQMLRFRPVP